ncbi:hypothetical protein ACHAXA_009030, partial [Cyclostephanos tholiformis]
CKNERLLLMCLCQVKFLLNLGSTLFATRDCCDPSVGMGLWPITDRSVIFAPGPWTHRQVLCTLTRGLHISAHKYIKYLDKEFVYMINKGQWVILPYSAVQHLPGLCILLPGVIPQYRQLYLIKLDISDGFYRIALNVDDIPKLGVAFSTAPGEDPLLAMALPHPLDNLAESISSPDLALRNPWTPLPPVARDPSLPSPSTLLAYTDVYVGDHVGAAQDSREPASKFDYRCWPRTSGTGLPQKITCQQLLMGHRDCLWSTMKLVLGWIIDTVHMTISLPPHHIDCLGEIIDSFPATQKCTSIKCWHGALGKLRFMALALPGLHDIFSAMQNALSTQSKGRIALHKGVHDALDDFHWMHRNISTCPMRIAELIPLPSVATGHHDASGSGAGGIWFPGPNITPRLGIKPTAPIVWRHVWPEAIKSHLITDSNLSGSLGNSDLELTGGLLHLDTLN